MEPGLQQGHKRLSNERCYQTGKLWCSPFPGDQDSLERVLQPEQSRKQLIETLFYEHTVIITSYPTNGHYATVLIQLCKSQVTSHHSRYRATKSLWAGASWTFWCLATEPVVWWISVEWVNDYLMENTDQFKDRKWMSYILTLWRVSLVDPEDLSHLGQEHDLFLHQSSRLYE